MNAQAIPYFEIIHKYIPPNSLTYAYYLPHVAAVTAKALRIAYRLGLDATQRRFIEEAAMLHDIGIVRVHAP
ncbi:MAG TPA: phosphohydrolase, partial [Anaerolineae bacterium]|nr:phosphohydrolase [Anaerolineae bacterium]